MNPKWVARNNTKKVRPANLVLLPAAPRYRLACQLDPLATAAQQEVRRAMDQTAASVEAAALHGSAHASTTTLAVILSGLLNPTTVVHEQLACNLKRRPWTGVTC
jgi:hypothetical protein